MLHIINLLIPFIIQVESGGDSLAYNAKEDACGWLQIRMCVVEDVNRKYKMNFTSDDRDDKDKSIRICSMYLEIWGKHYEDSTGKDATFEVLARIWNGGPLGYKKESTLKYWSKVESALKLNEMKVL
jgi:hypothetical protein